MKMISQVFTNGPKGRSNVIGRIEMSQRCFKPENRIKVKARKTRIFGKLGERKGNQC